MQSLENIQSCWCTFKILECGMALKSSWILVTGEWEPFELPRVQIEEPVSSSSSDTEVERPKKKLGAREKRERLAERERLAVKRSGALGCGFLVLKVAQPTVARMRSSRMIRVPTL